MDSKDPVKMLSWDLNDPFRSRSVAMSWPDDDEYIFRDRREKVKRKDLMKNGRFRSIVELRMYYRDPNTQQLKRYSGTGWLIARNLVATVGHNICNIKAPGTFSWGVVAKLGSNGNNSIARTQIRRGTKAVVAYAWANQRMPVHDFAFIRLNDSFSEVERIPFAITPPRGPYRILIAGYPADHRIGGSEMLVEPGFVNWNLDRDGGLVTYRISTTYGNSGSPVLLDTGKRLVAIATHVGRCGNRNRASPIGTNPINAYETIIQHFFTGPFPPPQNTFKCYDTRVKIHYLPRRLVSSRRKLHHPPRNPPNDQVEEYHRFSSTWTNAGKIHNVASSESTKESANSTRLNIPQTTVLAGTIIGCGLEMCSWFQRCENNFAGMNDYPDTSIWSAERAVLAEGALQFLLAYNGPLKTGILNLIKESFERQYRLVGACAIDLISEFSIGVQSVSSLPQDCILGSSEVSDLLSMIPGPENRNGTEQVDDGRADSFRNRLSASIGGDHELHDLLERADRFATGHHRPSLGLEMYLKLTLPSLGDCPQADRFAIYLAERAILGMLALDAVVYSKHHDELENRGLFDCMRDVALQIWPGARSRAPALVTSTARKIRGKFQSTPFLPDA